MLAISTASSEGHLSSDVASKVVGDYRIQFTSFPSILTSGQQTELVLSIQDLNGNNLRNLKLVIKILERDKTVHEIPEKTYPYGDFSITYTFNADGNYKLQIEILEEAKKQGQIVDFDLTVYREDIVLLLTYSGPIIFIAITVGAIVGAIFVTIRETKKTPKKDAST